MKLTRERKVLGAVLGLGLGALAVDRLFLASSASGPADAEAAAAYAVTPSKLPAAAAASLLHDAAGGSPDTIARRLREHAQAMRLQPDTSRDAFCPSPAWVSPPARGPAVVAPAGTPASGLGAFVQAHRLEAVMGGGAGGEETGIAIIDGQAYRVGQVIDGMQLVEVRQRSVVLRSAAGSVELSLSDAGP